MWGELICIAERESGLRESICFLEDGRAAAAVSRLGPQSPWAPWGNLVSSVVDDKMLVCGSMSFRMGDKTRWEWAYQQLILKVAKVKVGQRQIVHRSMRRTFTSFDSTVKGRDNLANPKCPIRSDPAPWPRAKAKARESLSNKPPSLVFLYAES